MKRPAFPRPFVARSVALAGVLLALAAGCGRQGEGERCSPLNGNQDCEGNLVCTPAGELRDGEDGVDRCCPPDERTDAIRACQPRVARGRANPATGGAPGNENGAGMGAAGGAAGGSN